MAPSFTNWLRGLKSTLLGPRRNRPRPATRPTRSTRLSVESLEDRAVPAVHTWTDFTFNWSSPSNWIGGVPLTGEPGGTVVVFPTSPIIPGSVQDIVGLVIDRIDFTGTGNIITLSTPLGLNGSVSTNQLTNAGGANIISGSTINLSGATAYFQIDAGIVETRSTIAGNQGIRKLGAGTLRITTFAFAPPNTYTGTTTIADGVLELFTFTADAGLSDTIVIGDGIGAPGSAVLRNENNNQIPNNATVTILADGLWDMTSSISFDDITTLNMGSATGGGTMMIGPGGGLTIRPGGTVNSIAAPTSSTISRGPPGVGSGPLRLMSTTVFTVADGAAAEDLVVSAGIFEEPFGVGAGLTKAGPGTLVLTADNPYTGTTTVNAGTLVVNGNQYRSAVNLTAGTLGGGGTVLGLTATGGTVAPGLGASPRTLSVGTTFASSNLNLGTTFAPAIAGTASDQLNVTGTVNLTGATLTPIVIGGVPAGASYTLISNDGTDPVVGTFAGLPQGAVLNIGGQMLVLSYTGGDGNDVTLSAPVYSNSFMFGDFLILLGAGFPGGFTFYPMPKGTLAFFADITGDGNGDVILILPNAVAVIDGVSGKFVAISADLNGDGVRDLQLFNPDGTFTRIDGKTGMIF